MKIQAAHFAHIQTVVSTLDTAELRKEYREAGLSDKRYRWDLTYKANLTQYICDTLYPYLNDTHIDTALRSMVKPLWETGKQNEHTGKTASTG